MNQSQPAKPRARAAAITPKKCLRAILKIRPIGVRCYDNGGDDAKNGTFDRYTVVFTGRYRQDSNRDQLYVSMSAHPFHPMGFGQHCSSAKDIDRPSYRHLGKKVSFDSLPEDCQRLVMTDCFDLSITAI
jgi:hypothetical protein